MAVACAGLLAVPSTLSIAPALYIGRGARGRRKPTSFVASAVSTAVLLAIAVASRLTVAAAALLAKATLHVGGRSRGRGESASAPMVAIVVAAIPTPRGAIAVARGWARGRCKEAAAVAAVAGLATIAALIVTVARLSAVAAVVAAVARGSVGGRSVEAAVWHRSQIQQRSAQETYPPP